MPKFKKNPNPIRYKKSSGFKMKSSPAKTHGKKSAMKNYKKGYYGA